MLSVVCRAAGNSWVTVEARKAMVERYLMEMAIEKARLCQPKDPEQIPMVGAVIEHNGKDSGRWIPWGRHSCGNGRA